MNNYPLLCKVWLIDESHPKVEFAVIVEESHCGLFEDQNGVFWNFAEPLTIEQFSNPVRLLEGNKQYDHLTIAPKPKDEWDNMDKINDFNEWHK
jgi:hypothetical protein